MGDSANSRRKTRQRTIGTIVATVALAYGTYRLARWWYFKDDEENEVGTDVLDEAGQVIASEQDLINQVQSQNNPHEQLSRHPDLLSKQMRTARIVACREQVSASFPGFVVQLRRMIDLQTDVSNETRRLKQLRSSDTSANDEFHQQQTELWELIKIKSLTLAIATTYAHTLLYLALTVSTHVVFGWQARQERDRHDDACSSSDINVDGDLEDVVEVHKFVLHRLMSSLIDKATGGANSGLDRLVHVVQKAVTSDMAAWNVRDPALLHVTSAQLQEAMDSVWNRAVEIEAASSHQKEIGLMCFLVDDTVHIVEGGLANSATKKNSDVVKSAAQAMFDETLDVLESPVCRDAQRECVGACLRMLQGKVFGWDAVVPPLPFAKILTQLRKQAKTFYSSEATNKLTTTLATLPAVIELCNVSFH
ncbi:hypothetical protein MPSEU_000567600 [Mayamaea pseudoterrestris]|nr:hypothetical protein MPSEU_000567600 [Mayamaea pseudoterrestris]